MSPRILFCVLFFALCSLIAITKVSAGEESCGFAAAFDNCHDGDITEGNSDSIGIEAPESSPGNAPCGSEISYNGFYADPHYDPPSSF